MIKQNTIRTLYRKLLMLYPKAFRERLAKPMEQTFNDLCNEKRQENQSLFGFVLWTFIETGMGIFREHLLLVSYGEIMKNMLTAIGSPALLGVLLLLPFTIMEIVNRREFNEEFPFVLFLALWLNLFAAIAILFPIIRALWTRKQDMENPVPAQGGTLLTNSKSSLIISILLILAPSILPLMDSLGWLSVDRLVNGPNPEVEYLPGLFITIGIILLPITGGVVASHPIVNTLRTQGKLFAHPIHLIIVVVLSFLFAMGVGSLIVDQWPCFIGVPVCD
jgi:hypothetical protein